MPLLLSDYSYPLPDELIAQAPVTPRDSCRLLVLNRRTGTMEHRQFRDLADYLTPNDCLVLNNTRVMPARIFGKKKTGGTVELLLLHERETNVWECLVRPGRRLLPGTRAFLGTLPEVSPDRTANINCHSERSEESAFKNRFLGLRPRNDRAIEAEIIERSANGTRLVRFHGIHDIRTKLAELGKIPFPPYVKEAACPDEEYQTIYAKHDGSVAAPTAGLHFTNSLLQSLKSQGVSIIEVTLHVGWGTFRPVRSDDVTEHQMEKEWVTITPEAASALNQAESAGKRIIAVGTTACRVLETLPAGKIESRSGWTNLFIYPGFQFKRTQALITNFHLPHSTLLMLVCAFAGQEKTMRAYQEAVRLRYRFYSFGDAMLIMG